MSAVVQVKMVSENKFLPEANPSEPALRSNELGDLSFQFEDSKFSRHWPYLLAHAKLHFVLPVHTHQEFANLSKVRLVKMFLHRAGSVDFMLIFVVRVNQGHLLAETGKERNGVLANDCHTGCSCDQGGRHFHPCDKILHPFKSIVSTYEGGAHNDHMLLL